MFMLVPLPFVARCDMLFVYTSVHSPERESIMPWSLSQMIPTPYITLVLFF